MDAVTVARWALLPMLVTIPAGRHQTARKNLWRAAAPADVNRLLKRRLSLSISILIYKPVTAALEQILFSMR